MAQITISVTNAQGTVAVTKDIPAAHLARVLAYLGDFMDGKFQKRGPNAEEPPAKTDANVFRAWANYVLNGLVRQVKDYEQRQAAVTGIDLTDA
jgi:hypothetical protein